MTSKTAYQTDFAGLYAGTTIADESPMEPGVYLLPARATFQPPPESWPDDKWPRFNGVDWALVTRPVLPVAMDPVEKLRRFLADNPDVAQIVNPES